MPIDINNIYIFEKSSSLSFIDFPVEKKFEEIL